MARSMVALLRVGVVAALATQILTQVAQAQSQCYYPNGNPAPSSEQPCSTKEGSACCPFTFECLDNGLCRNPANNYYGTYSCTDKSWKSPGCASNMCTYDFKRPGGEGLTQCSDHDNQWCCNADMVHVNCCQESPSPRPFFKLQDGKPYATIGKNQASTNPTLSGFTGLASGTGGGSAPSRTPSPSSAGSSSANAAQASSRPLSTPDPVTSVLRSVSSGAAGVVTVERTIVSTPTAAAGGTTSTNTSSSGKSSNLGVIIGCAVGIPLALALVGILFWILRKRRNQKKASAYTKNTPEMEGSPAVGFAGAKLGKDTYKSSRPGTAEIDGAPVGPGRPVSHLPGHAELDSGAGFQPGHGPAYAPDTVGLGGGTGDGQAAWSSPPPGYSTATNQAGFVHPPNANAMELADTSVLPVPASQPQQYQAYRPPQPVAELPTVKTPPEDVEKQLQR
ncbi:hypothetical protein CC86DRAFT_119762 [Ophiobolus disseminans]|uniref:Mid2 domain-containing protein n=1 Tax=Ophiobolus disseminans TaxID=1469910 RepID=A0A6A6ZJE5_9PLEO|nr:hypothetical protein CC86DRAFT_119762 [Ophiobolus disseminans]